jgi:hypothetical protein
MSVSFILFLTFSIGSFLLIIIHTYPPPWNNHIEENNSVYPDLVAGGEGLTE